MPVKKEFILTFRPTDLNKLLLIKTGYFDKRLKSNRQKNFGRIVNEALTDKIVETYPELTKITSIEEQKAYVEYIEALEKRKEIDNMFYEKQDIYIKIKKRNNKIKLEDETENIVQSIK